MTDEKWINWTLVRRLNHGRMSRALCLEAGDRIEELESTLQQYLDNADARMVRGFNFDTGEYPVTAETISILCAEKQQLQAKLDAVLNCKEYAWKRMEGKYEPYFLKADVLKALEEREDD